MFIRLLILALVLVWANASAQSLVVSEVDEFVSGQPESDLLQAHATVTNTSTSPIEVMVRFEMTNGIPTGAGHYFCWAVCYNEGTVFNGFETAANHAISIDPGASSINFAADYVPHNSVGSATFRYTFYDKNNTSDATSAEITFSTQNVGIEDVLTSGVSGISESYPNPARSSVNINYALDQGWKSANLTIYSMLGSQVENVNLNEDLGTVNLDVASLPAGMYFYTLNVDGKSISTKKMLVTK